MMNVIRSNFYKISKSKIGYCLLVVVFFTIIICSDKKALLPASYQITKFADGMNYTGILAFIFAPLMVSIDFNDGSIKNIIGRGIDKSKYILGNIISLSILSIFIWLFSAFLVALILVTTYKFGAIDNTGNVFLTYCLGAINMIASITILVSATVVIKSGIAGAIIGVIIYNIGTVVAFIGEIFHKNINISKFSLSYYLSTSTEIHASTGFILVGILLGLAYIIIFGIMGIVIFKKQDVK